MGLSKKPAVPCCPEFAAEDSKKGTPSPLVVTMSQVNSEPAREGDRFKELKALTGNNQFPTFLSKAARSENVLKILGLAFTLVTGFIFSQVSPHSLLVS